jgi:hypothetical protein
LDDTPKTNHRELGGAPDSTILQPAELAPHPFEGAREGHENRKSLTSSPPAHPAVLTVSPPEAHAYELVALDVANASTDSAQYCAKIVVRERHEGGEVECKVLSIVPRGGQVRFTIQVPNMGTSPQDCGVRVETRGETPCSGGDVPFQYMPPLEPNIVKLDPPSVVPGGWLSIHGAALGPGDVVEFSGIPVEACRDLAGVVVQHGVAVVAAPEVRCHSEQLIEAKAPDYKSRSAFGGYVSVTRVCPDATSLVSNYSYLKFWGSESSPKPKDGLQDRLVNVEQRCAVLTDKLEAATRGGAIAGEVGALTGEVSALKRGVEEIRSLLGALPISARDNYTCTCGAKGWIAVRVRCTCCGRDSTVGFFPPPTEEKPLREP